MFPCFFGAFKTFSQFSAVAFRNLGQIWISQNLKQYVTPLGTMHKLKITRAPKNLWTACNKKNSKNYICPSVELSNLDATENMTRPPLQFWSATSRWSPGTVFGRWDNWFFWFDGSKFSQPPSSKKQESCKHMQWSKHLLCERNCKYHPHVAAKLPNKKNTVNTISVQWGNMSPEIVSTWAISTWIRWSR